ncbi:hypothetical protein Tco_0921900 [Tanacetum coccineum]
MTKVIKGEFKKNKDVKVEDVSLTCDTPLAVFNNEVSRLSRMDDDLFTYEVEVANIPCHSNMDDDSEHKADDDMGYDSSNIRGDDEVELTDEESSNDMDEVVEVFRIDTNLFDYETPIWMDDGYCNGGNLPGSYIIGNQLHYQDYEWYEALEDSKLKDNALKNKAIMEGLISDDESSNDCWKRWKSYEIYYNMKMKLMKKDMSYVVSKLVSNQNSCDFTTITINGESEERRIIKEIRWNYYDREDGETTPRSEV